MIETMYEKSPVWVQNILVATAGLQLHLQRKGGGYKQSLQQVRESQMQPPASLAQAQLRSLKRIVTHALDTVPFYREWSRKNHISARDINSIKDITLLPIVEKDNLRENPEFYCSTPMLEKAGRICLHTSGTTGKPLNVYCDKESRRLHFAYWERFLEWHGVGNNSVRATFCGRTAIPQAQATAPFWRHDPAQKNVLFSSYHLSEKNMPFYMDKLRRLQAAYLDGYPSSLAYVANYMLAHAEPPFPGLKAVITSAETLLPCQREALNKAFQVPVADQYGCTEMAVFISQCRHGSYHVNTDYSFLEVLDENGEPALPGEWGEAICSTFVNMTMPLIRYRLGDLLRAPEPSACRCGSPFPVTKELLGRQDEMITTADGRQVGRLDPAFKGIENIQETQLVQTAVCQLTVKLVATSKFTKDDELKLVQALRARLGDQMAITFEYVKSIPRESNGKFRSVISLVKS